MRILTVIPMFNLHEMTSTCVNMTLRMSGLKNEELDILIVDDGSTKPYVFEDYSHGRVHILTLPENTGFTNATNQGILWAMDQSKHIGIKYDYIHTLNNDTEPEQDFVKYLVEAIESDENIGVASSVRLHKDHDGSIYRENYGLDLIRGHQLISKDDLPIEVIPCTWLPICSALLRVSMIQDIGLLDKRFKNHCSDSDYCIQAGARGWKTVLVTKSKVLHHWSLTVKENKINPSDDQKLFIEKLAGVQFAHLMAQMPLDCESNTYGRLQFLSYKGVPKNGRKEVCEKVEAK